MALQEIQNCIDLINTVTLCANIYILPEPSICVSSWKIVCVQVCTSAFACTLLARCTPGVLQLHCRRACSASVSGKRSQKNVKQLCTWHAQFTLPCSLSPMPPAKGPLYNCLCGFPLKLSPLLCCPPASKNQAFPKLFASPVHHRAEWRHWNILFRLRPWRSCSDLKSGRSQ